ESSKDARQGAGDRNSSGLDRRKTPQNLNLRSRLIGLWPSDQGPGNHRRVQLHHAGASWLCLWCRRVPEPGPLFRVIREIRGTDYNRAMKTDPVRLEIFKSLFHAIAEEMGATLKRTAFSPNIKERRDYSCAVFDHN